MSGVPAVFIDRDGTLIEDTRFVRNPAEVRLIPGATEALVPEFIDFILDDPLAEARDRERLQTRVRGGLAWLDRECRGRFSKAFVECAAGERTAVLDDIAWPEKARPEMAR